MMRVIFLLLVSSIALQSKSQTWNNYLQKRFKSYGIWADSVLLLPSDTTINKAAKSLAVKNGNLYIANGTYWTEISGGSSVVDSLGVIIAAKPSFGDVRDVVSDSMGYVRSNFQPLENQRLSTGDNVEFSNVSVKKEIIIGEFGGDDGKIRFIDRGTGNVGNLTNGRSLTDDRTWYLPDRTGIVALDSDIADSVANAVKYTDTTSMLAGYRDATILTSGTLDDARLSSNVPKMVSNVLPAVDGSLLTNLNPASIATVVQTITATATINNSTTTLLVNPATVVSSLSITLCAAPYQTQIIRIVFGGTITSGNQVVTTLSILPNSGQSVVRVFPSVEAFAGDFIAFQYINTNWYQIN